MPMPQPAPFTLDFGEVAGRVPNPQLVAAAGKSPQGIAANDLYYSQWHSHPSWSDCWHLMASPVLWNCDSEFGVWICLCSDTLQTWFLTLGAVLFWGSESSPSLAWFSRMGPGVGLMPELGVPLTCPDFPPWSSFSCGQKLTLGIGFPTWLFH